MGAGHVAGDQADFKTQWLRRCVGGHVPAGEVGITQLVGGKGQRGLACVQLAISARFVQKAPRQAEGLLAERQRGRMRLANPS